ncbi:MAG: FHA domain-containing protein [Methanolinea sp.]|nr:FHA domain-containing protein [Methanolinea sp.]
MDEKSGTVLQADDREFLEELSEYLEVLGNSTRLRILTLLEKRSLDARSISIEIETSYENTKKHLEKMLHSGLITRRPGVGRETSKGIHPAWEYFPSPGAIEGIQRDLGVFSTLSRRFRESTLEDRIFAVRRQVALESGKGGSMLVMMGGEWDGRQLPLPKDCLVIGRSDPGLPDTARDCALLALPESYRSVTRISREHARITRSGTSSLVEDCGSTGGTYVNGKRLGERQRHTLRDGDMIDLSIGSFGAKLLFLDPQIPGEKADG